MTRLSNLNFFNMKSLLNAAIFFLIVIVASSCSAGKPMAEANGDIHPVSASDPVREGSIVYGLPRTVFTVVAEMQRTIERPGPYAQYAEDLLGLTDVIKTPGESWKITGVTIKSHEEIDPSELYVISSTTLFQTNVLTMKREGLILDLNPDTFQSSDSKSNSMEQGNISGHSVDLGSDEYFRMQRDTAYRRMNIDSAFVKVPYIVEKKKKLPLDQLAEKAAKRLMELRDGKHLILTGEANVFPQSDAAINEINRLEKSYTELFTGKTMTETLTYTYDLIPQKTMVGKPVTIFQFSDQTGPAGTGKSVTAEFTPEKKTKDMVVTKPGDKKYDKLFYRAPDVVNVKISSGNDKLFESRKLIYQFGDVIQLPANYIIGR
jgi:hypothetical protein